MKSYTVTIDKDALCVEVFRITANAAKERGDALHVATEEDKDLIEGFFSAAMPALRAGFGRFLEGVDDSGFKYLMPENWKVDEETVKECCNGFLVSIALAKWFELSGIANGYVNAAQVAMEALRICLNMRKKPIR